MKNYSYPIDSNWSIDEMTKVIHLWTSVEKAYESSIKKEDFIQAYRDFKEVVPMKMDEKRLSKTFEKRSGYSLYQTLKKAKATPDSKSFSMGR